MVLRKNIIWGFNPNFFGQSSITLKKVLKKYCGMHTNNSSPNGEENDEEGQRHTPHFSVSILGSLFLIPERMLGASQRSLRHCWFGGAQAN